MNRSILNLRLLPVFLLGLLLNSCTTGEGPGLPLAASYGRKLAVVSEGAFSKGNGSLDIISLSDTLLTHTMKVLGDAPNDVIITGGKLYILVTGSNSLLVLDTATYATTKTISFDLAVPNKMVLGPNNTLLVTQRASNSLEVIDLSTNTKSNSINVGTGSAALAMLQGSLYVSGGYDSLMKVNPITTNVEKTVKLDASPEIVIADSARGQIIVMTGGDFGLGTLPKVYWLDKDLNKLDSIVLGSFSFAVSDLFFGGNMLYAVSENKIVTIDPVSHVSVPFISNPQHGYYKGIYDPIEKSLYVGEYNFNSEGAVDVYDAISGTFLRSFSAGIAPAHFAFY